MKPILLRNIYKTGIISDFTSLYYPRLQINKHGEIILALNKRGTLTSGILVAKTAESKSNIPIGKRFDDWEVAGELEDYDGEVDIIFKNQVLREDVL